MHSEGDDRKSVNSRNYPNSASSWKSKKKIFLSHRFQTTSFRISFFFSSLLSAVGNCAGEKLRVIPIWSRCVGKLVFVAFFHHIHISFNGCCIPIKFPTHAYTHAQIRTISYNTLTRMPNRKIRRLVLIWFAPCTRGKLYRHQRSASAVAAAVPVHHIPLCEITSSSLSPSSVVCSCAFSLRRYLSLSHQSSIKLTKEHKS